MVATTPTSGGSEHPITASIRIDPLLGSKNFATWKVKIQDILVSARLQDYLTEKPPEAPEGDNLAELAAHTQKYQEWERCDRQALGHIRLCVSDAVLVYISGALMRPRSA
jgi:hypothetical protein